MVLPGDLRKVIPAFRRRPSTAQWDLSMFSCSALAGSSAQFLCDFAMEWLVYDGSACSGSFRKKNHPLCQPLFELVSGAGM
jgi:hypothetical protein